MNNNFSFAPVILCFTIYCASCQNGSNSMNEPIEKIDSLKDVELIDTLSEEIAPFVEKDSNYCFFVYNDGSEKYGFKNKEGKVIIRPKFELAGNFDGDYAPVAHNGTHGFCDTTGKIVYKLNKLKFEHYYNELSGEPILYGQSEGLYLVVSEKDKFGFVNNKAELIIPCEFESLQAFSEGFAVFTENDKYGFINKQGKKIIPAKYDYAFNFSEGLAAVRNNEKVGFINAENEFVIPAIYTQATFFKEGLAAVSKSENYTNFFFINTKGEVIIAGPFEMAANFENGEAIVEKRGKCSVINKQGVQLRTIGTDCFQGC